MTDMILIVGGPLDGARVAGERRSLRFMNNVTKETLDYDRATIAGSTRPFDVFVPREHILDGDWVLERLTEGYHKTIPSALAARARNAVPTHCAHGEPLLIPCEDCRREHNEATR